MYNAGVSKEVSRRVFIAGMLGIGVDLALTGDNNREVGLQQRHPYRQNPEQLAISNRPIQIVVDPKEQVLHPETITLSSQDIPPPLPIRTQSMQERGYRELYVKGESKFYEAAVVDEAVAAPLWEVVDPLKELRPEDATDKIRFFPVDPQTNALFSGKPVPEQNMIIIQLTPDTPTPTQLLKTVAFHEEAHIIEDSIRLPDSYNELYQGFLDDAEVLYKAYKDKLEDKGTPQSEIQEEMTRIGVFFDNLASFKALGPLANALTESSYHPFDSPESGHPLTTIHELFASTLTVAKFYPNSLLATIDGLPDPKDQKHVRDVIRQSLDILRTFADDPEKVDGLFPKEITDL